MQINDIPFGVTDWASIERTGHKGQTGVDYWRTQTEHIYDIYYKLLSSGLKLIKKERNLRLNLKTDIDRGSSCCK